MNEIKKVSNIVEKFESCPASILDKFVHSNGKFEEIEKGLYEKYGNKNLTLDQIVKLEEYLLNLKEMYHLFYIIWTKGTFFIDENVEPNLKVNENFIEYIKKDIVKKLNELNEKPSVNKLKGVFIKNYLLEKFDQGFELQKDFSKIDKRICYELLKEYNKQNEEIKKELDEIKEKALNYLIVYPDKKIFGKNVELDRKSTMNDIFLNFGKINNIIKNQIVTTKVFNIIEPEYKLNTKLDELFKGDIFNLYCTANKDLGIKLNNEGYYETKSIEINKHNFEEISKNLMLREETMKRLSKF